MLEIEYTISETQTAMYVANEHTFCLENQSWLCAISLKAGDSILAKNGSVASITKVKLIEGEYKCRDLMVSHNHNYFVSTSKLHSSVTNASIVPNDPLELIPYQLADKPSHFADGKPTGHHSGPWVAARYMATKPSEDAIAWGRANDLMCAEDAAISNLRLKLGNEIELHQGNVEISHAYIRKYTKKGRFVNTMSPCLHCRDNYGAALNDVSLGTSDLVKTHRDQLPLPQKD